LIELCTVGLVRGGGNTPLPGAEKMNVDGKHRERRGDREEEIEKRKKEEEEKGRQNVKFKWQRIGKRSAA